MHRTVFGAIFFVSVFVIAACQGSDEKAGRSAPSAAASVALEDILDPIRDRQRLEKATFFGDTAWAIDYYGGLFGSEDAGQNWNRVVLPKDGRITAMQFEDDGRLGFVVTKRGQLMRTADAGHTWTTTDLVAQVREAVDVEYGGYFDQITFDSSLENGQWIDYCQIFETSNGGNTWIRRADGLQDKGSEERCVANAAYNSATGSWFAEVEIYGRFLTSGNYLFRSDNDGTTWQEICSLDEVGLLLESIQSCFELEADDDDGLKSAVNQFSEDMWQGETEAQEAFLEQIDRGIFVSHSLAVPDDLNQWHDQLSLTADRTNGRVWLSNDEQIAYTEDGGMRWHVVSNAMPKNDNLDFSLGSDRGFAIYQNEFLAVSEDIGRTWQILNNEPRPIYDFKVLPDHNRIIVATDTGLALVDADTFDWRDLPDVGEGAELVVVGPVVWTFARDGSVHRSTDAGVTWTMLPVNLEQEDFYVEAASCTARQCLLEGYESVARLTAAPFDIEIIELVELLPDLDENYVVKIVLDAELDRAWAAMYDGSLHASVDGGKTWQKLAELREEISEFRSAPGKANFMAWGETNRYLWSGDGETFETRTLPTSKDTAIYSLCWVNESIVLVDGYDERLEEDLYFASIDGGATWGAMEPITFDDLCRVPGGLVVLDTMIATVK